jgi:hypothetical protein
MDEYLKSHIEEIVKLAQRAQLSVRHGIFYQHI